MNNKKKHNDDNDENAVVAGGIKTKTKTEQTRTQKGRLIVNVIV